MDPLSLLKKLIHSVIPDIKLPDHISADSNNIDIKVGLFNFNAPVKFNKTVVHIDASNPEGQALAAKIFENASALTEKGQRAAETDFAGLIEEAKPAASATDEDEQLIKNIRTFVPESDIPIIQAALFIRKLHRQKANVSRYKALVYAKYGSRGNNICNLITADYYDEYLVPFYRQLKEYEGENTDNIFREIYEEAVTQYPFAVFVSRNRGHEAIKEELGDKIALNLATDQHVLNVHGIGSQNKKKINKLLADPEIAKIYIAEPDIIEFSNTIYARIYF